MKLKIIIHREVDGRYSVAAPALPGCYSWGDTLEEARANIREAAEGWLDANGDRNPFDATEAGTDLIEEVEL
ncbi:MAG: type II toxin-antitoxin system HicB family antitoxin [Planctomycetes bacterium]|nr:type II toxin-antitoxin system HicB family antitoxin [Planctomycetota bacterium]